MSLTLVAAGWPAAAAPRPEYGRIESMRDSWGIPHVFSETDAGARYGLGHATAEDLSVPGITCLDGQTIRSRAGQSYTQWVPLHDVDAAQSVCPIGHSDRPDSPWRKSTLTLWREGTLHPAPLGRAAVEKIATTRRVWDGVNR